MSLPVIPRRWRHRGKNVESRVRIRVRLFLKQSGRCAACWQPVWESRFESVHAYKKRMSAERNEVISLRRIKRQRKATLDHYIPQSQGGTVGDPRNKVLCRQCNCGRGDTPWEDFLQQLWGERP